MKVCHLTSAHETNDDRIFLKECESLSRAGHEVYLVGKGGDRTDSGVHVVGCGEMEGRLKRFTKFTKKVYKTALELNCDVYHFHDPELLPYGLKLKRKGKTVIFDSHEDVPAQINDKTWIPKIFRGLVSNLYRNYESHVVKRLDAVVAATPHIASKFRERTRDVVVVNNYPSLDDIVFHEKPFGEKDAIACYAGSISEDRGENIMKNAMEKVDGKLVIAGLHDAEKNGKVEYIGFLNRAGVNDLYKDAVVGLCILKPIENYYYSQPIKMYEYMAAGLPFVCSNFPGWVQIAKESEAGICVDPENLDEIAQAINSLLKDRSKAQEMGRKGHDYVVSNCTWANEENTLVRLYKELENS